MSLSSTTFLWRQYNKFAGSTVLSYNIHLPHMLEEDTLYYNPDAEAVAGQIHAKAMAQFLRLCKKLHRTIITADKKKQQPVTSKYKVFPVCVDDDLTGKIIYQDLASDIQIFAKLWESGINIDCLQEKYTAYLARDFVYDICMDAYAAPSSREMAYKEITSVIHAIATFAQHSLRYAMRGQSTPGKYRSKTWVIKQWSRDTNTWSWFSAAYALVPQVIMREIDSGGCNSGNFHAHHMTCASCSARMLRKPSAIQAQKTIWRNEQDFWYYGTLSTTVSYIDILKRDKNGRIHVTTDVKAMQCLAWQIQFEKVLAAHCNLQKEIIRALWPGCQPTVSRAAT